MSVNSQPPSPTPADTNTDSHSRGLGLVSLVFLVVANMIGAGLFTTSGFTLGSLHTPGRVVLAWFIGGVIALCGAVGYATAIRRITESGGEYLFLSRWVHPAAGCAAGWVSLLAGFTGPIAASARALATYLPPEWFAGFPAREPVIASVVIIVFAVIHALGRGPGIGIQNLAVAIKLLLIIAIAGVMYSGGAQQNWPGANQVTTPADASAFDWATCLMYIAFGYCGFNAAIYLANESKRPASLVPRAMYIGTLLVAVIYVVLNALLVYGAPAELLINQQDVAAVAVRFAAGPTWEYVLRLTVVVCLLTGVSSMVLAGPYVYAKMAADGALPRWFRKQGDIPRTALALQTILALAFVWSGSFRSLLNYLGMTLALSAAGTVAAAIWTKAPSQQDSSSETKPKTNPLAMIAAVIFIFATLVSAGLSAWRNPWEAATAVMTLTAGFIYWQAIGKRVWAA